MSAELAEKVRDYLARLQSTQAEMARVSARKREALRRADAPSMLTLAATETNLVTLLRQHVGERQTLLDEARLAGHPAKTIRELVDRLPGESAELRRRLDAARATTNRLRSEAWVHWIVAKRAEMQFGELREMIANHGRRSPTYDTPADAPRAAAGPGGSVLDAEV